MCVCINEVFSRRICTIVTLTQMQMCVEVMLRYSSNFSADEISLFYLENNIVNDRQENVSFYFVIL